MTEFVRWGTSLLAVPTGYKKKRWEDVKQGQLVYIAGIKNGEPWAYGPHEVFDPARKLLKKLPTPGKLLRHPQVFVENTDAVLVRTLTAPKSETLHGRHT